MSGFVFSSVPKSTIRVSNDFSTRNRCLVTMRNDIHSDRSASRGSTPGRQANTSESTEDTLLQDIKSMRARRPPSSETEQSTNSVTRIKSLVESILLWDFFLVLGLLGWLAVALVPHFVSKNDVLLDPWLALWQPFIQPVLGVLMLGTIAQGTISFISKK